MASRRSAGSSRPRASTFDRPYQEIEALGLAIAFFTDPWGTYIELTEGLDEY